ncbi:Gfo/Idh/MocA family oxidoreductase [Candidatus Omnitrophota bacterium]
MKKLNIGIIGIGHLGSRHLKVYSELSEKVNIIGICDSQKERTLKLAEHYKVDYYEDYTELADKVDAVNICVPTESHYDVGKFFLEKGIHCLIEKPISTTVEQAEELVAIAEKTKAIFQVGHIERFNSAFESIKRLTHNPLFIECHRLNHFPNRSLDIGVVMDLMIHDIDIVLGAVPSKITDIQATGINVLTPLDDIASVRLTFENGCVCNLTASRISDEVMRKIRIFQKDSYISLDYCKQEAFIYKKSDKTILKHSLPIEKHESLKKELEHFLTCVNTNTKPLVSGVEGKEALKIALQISQIIWDKQKNI